MPSGGTTAHILSVDKGYTTCFHKNAKYETKINARLFKKKPGALPGVV